MISPGQFAVILGVRNWSLVHLERCLCSLERFGLEVRVVNLGQTPLEIPSRFSSVTVIEYPRSEWSRAVALNRGTRGLRPEVEYLVFTDADMIFPPSWAASVEEHIRLIWNGHLPGILLTPSRDLPKGWETRKGVNWLNEPGLYHTSVQHPPVGQGAAMVVPRHWFEIVGGFDEQYRVWGCEDTDLVLRAEWSGLPVLWLEKTFVAHQWHPREHSLDGPVWEAVRANRAYLVARVAEKGPIVRNRVRINGE